MNATLTIIIVVVVLVITGAIIGLVFSQRKHTQNLQKKFGTEYDHAVQNSGNEKQAQSELDERLKHIKTLDIHPLSDADRSRYLSEWTEVQSKFVDEPGKAIVDADRLITEVMLARNYPISDFEQRAADVSVIYPDFVSNYRAARVIADKNKEQQADTEELRQAMIYYRSLFKELLGTETMVAEEKVG